MKMSLFKKGQRAHRHLWALSENFFVGFCLYSRKRGMARNLSEIVRGEQATSPLQPRTLVEELGLRAYLPSRPQSSISNVHPGLRELWTAGDGGNEEKGTHTRSTPPIKEQNWSLSCFRFCGAQGLARLYLGAG